ncbi:MAG: hypothetical protein AAGI52_10045 [Bacteroidota bacterium]
MHRHLVLAFVLAAAPALAQDPPSLVTDSPRVLHSATTEVKGPDGAPATYQFRTVYDPVTGEYTDTVTDVDTGVVLRREVTKTSITSPSKDEHAWARSFIANDPEIAPLIAQAEYPVRVTGGFVLLREEGHVCGPGSRCVQYDILESLPDRKTANRIRYVVVDLRTGDFVSRDFDPDLDGNLANPIMRQQSRFRDASE